MLDPLDTAIQKLQTETPDTIALRGISFKNPKKFMLLLDALSTCYTLEVLTIDECRFSKPKKSKKNIVDDKNLPFEALLETLARHPTISWLFFTNNKIGDEGAKLISDKLGESGKFSSLTCLTLEGNLITEAGALFLTNAILKCPTLTKLTVDAKFSEINQQIEKNLAINIQRIKEFQRDILNVEILNYQTALVACPSLINARIKTGQSTILHTLVNDEKYEKRLGAIWAYHPNPFLNDVSSKKALHYAVAGHQQTLINYTTSYQPFKKESSKEIETSEHIVASEGPLPMREETTKAKRLPQLSRRKSQGLLSFKRITADGKQLEEKNAAETYHREEKKETKREKPIENEHGFFSRRSSGHKQSRSNSGQTISICSTPSTSSNSLSPPSPTSEDKNLPTISETTPSLESLATAVFKPTGGM